MRRADLEGAIALAAFFGCEPSECISPCLFGCESNKSLLSLSLALGASSAVMFVAKTDALFACAGARLATMLAVKADTLLACGSEQQ